VKAGTQVVLITGASGSIGTVLVQALSAMDGEIRALVRSVSAGERVRAATSAGSSAIRIEQGDIEDAEALARAASGVETVFHLAAEKDLVRCEECPEKAIRTNVGGTMAVIRALSLEQPRPFLVAASSAKASSPTSVLGMTKALMERVVCASGLGCAVRLGGVFGSSGSVVERWRQSAEERGEIEVTDPEITRFHIMPATAVQVLIEASRRRRPGEILVPPHRAYRLGDLAAAFSRVHGSRVREVGPRPGEIRHEALASADEGFELEGEWAVFDRTVMPKRPLSILSHEVPRVTESELEALVRGAPS
jgi:FlaA1/EpsC-like NDP-sugar epimerase